MITLFQAAQTQKYRGQIGTSGQWRQNSSWDGSIGDSYEVPLSLVLPDNSVKCHLTSKPRSQGDGADSFSSGWANKILTVEGAVYDDDAEALWEVERAVKAFSRRPHVKLQYRDDCYINLGNLRQVDWAWKELSNRQFVNARLSWEVGDPFWYELALSTSSHSPTGDGTLVVLAPTDCCFEPVYPVIKITAGAGQDLSAGVSLSNDYDDSLTLEYNDPNLSNGSYVIIDCEQGSVYRYDPAEVNSIRYFAGEMLRFLPGNNSISYAGQACTIEFFWRNRWV